MKLSIVTPSYNQARFLEACIDSVLNQNYPDLEYLVMDGGSKDLSVEILKTYGNQIIWVSEPDGGQAAAVNKGILRATGDVIGWLNSDDIYYPGSFEAVMKVFEEHPEIDVVYGHADHIREDGSYMEDYYTEKWDYERLKEVCFICQPAVFFRRQTVMDIGLLNPDRQFAMDYDLWLRMGKEHPFYFLNKKLAGSRLYAENKTLGFVEQVHIDIMDTVLEDTGSIPERWLQGSAESIARDKGYTIENEVKYREYVNFVYSKMKELADRFGMNKEHDYKKLPYSYASNMKIGIDASMALQDKPQGVGVTAREIIGALARNNPGFNYCIYPAFEDHIEEQCLNSKEYSEYKNVIYAYKGGIVSALYNVINHVRLSFAAGDVEAIDKMCLYPNVVLYPSFTFSKPLASRCASVYMLYDLSFLEHIEYTTEANFDYCYKHLFRAAMYADYFISISEYTKQKFLEYFPFVDPERVRVAYLGGKELYKHDPIDKDYEGLNVDFTKPFWLSVGTVEPRKNIINLIYAYAELKKQTETFPLYIAGGKGWKDGSIYKSVRELGLENDVHFLGYVTDQQLNALYHECYSLVYPSFYEGFGLPILEAMSAGAPVICSNTTSMPEVGGDAALYVDPASKMDIADKMSMLQNNRELRDSLVEKSRIQADRFGWDNCARVVQETIFSAISRRR